MCQDGTNAKEAQDKAPPMQEVGRVGMGVLTAGFGPPSQRIEITRVQGGYIITHGYGDGQEVAADLLGVLNAIQRRFGL